MEVWPIKFDWAVYQQQLAEGSFLPKACILELACADPPDCGSLNAALSDFFPLLRKHLTDEVTRSIGPLVGAIAMGGIRGFRPRKDGPRWLYDNSRDLSDLTVCQLYSPQTVAALVESYESVSDSNRRSALEVAWSKKSNDPSKYSGSTPEHFVDASDFMDYLEAWCSAFREARNEEHSIALGFG